MTNEESIASLLFRVCRRGEELQKEIGRLEKELADKRGESGSCKAELCYIISRLEREGNQHAGPLKLIVGMSDMEIGIAAGKYEAMLAFMRKDKREKLLPWEEVLREVNEGKEG